MGLESDGERGVRVGEIGVRPEKGADFHPPKW